jgi:hypothetical protein
MSVANVMFKVNNQPGGVSKAFSSLYVQPLAVNSVNGIVFGISNITAVATLTAITTQSFSSGCVIMCVSPAASITVRFLTNTGTLAAPSFTAIVSD